MKHVTTFLSAGLVLLFTVAVTPLLGQAQEQQPAKPTATKAEPAAPAVKDTGAREVPSPTEQKEAAIRHSNERAELTKEQVNGAREALDKAKAAGTISPEEVQRRERLLRKAEERLREQQTKGTGGANG